MPFKPDKPLGQRKFDTQDKTPVHGNYAKDCVEVTKTKEMAIPSSLVPIDYPRFVDESIRLALVGFNSSAAQQLLAFFYGEVYEKYKGKKRLLFILNARLKEMVLRLETARKSVSSLETYGGKLVLNSKYDTCEKLINFYQNLLNQFTEFFKDAKLSTHDRLALVVECKCCQKYLYVSIIKESMDYESYRKLNHLLDTKNCQVKIVVHNLTKRKLGQCKKHSQTLQHCLF